MNSAEPVVVARFDNPFAAHAARARLEAEGIEAHVIDENVILMDPLLAPALGGVKVIVPPSQFERAREILDAKVDVPEAVCEACGSSNVTTHRLGRRFSFLSILFLGLPMGRTKNLQRCEDCGHEWRE